MTERRQFRAIKGTRDILPPESARWNWFEQTAREVFESYNFGEIRLPILEREDLFDRSIGTDTDIAAKEMFNFDLKASREIWERIHGLSGSWMDPLRFTGYLYELIRVIRWALQTNRIERTDKVSKLLNEFQAVYRRLYDGIAEDSVLSKMRAHPNEFTKIYNAMHTVMLESL